LKTKKKNVKNLRTERRGNREDQSVIHEGPLKQKKKKGAKRYGTLAEGEEKGKSANV